MGCETIQSISIVFEHTLGSTAYLHCSCPPLIWSCPRQALSLELSPLCVLVFVFIWQFTRISVPFTFTTLSVHLPLRYNYLYLPKNKQTCIAWDRCKLKHGRPHGVEIHVMELAHAMQVHNHMQLKSTKQPWSYYRYTNMLGKYGFGVNRN